MKTLPKGFFEKERPTTKEDFDNEVTPFVQYTYCGDARVKPLTDEKAEAFIIAFNNSKLVVQERNKPIIAKRKFDDKSSFSGCTNLVCEITEFMDTKLKYEPSTHMYTYLNIDIAHDSNHFRYVGIRLPGATRGNIVVDKENVIREFNFIESTCLRDYVPFDKSEFDKFIGRKLIIEEFM